MPNDATGLDPVADRHHVPIVMCVEGSDIVAMVNDNVLAVPVAPAAKDHLAGCRGIALGLKTAVDVQARMTVTPSLHSKEIGDTPPIGRPAHCASTMRFFAIGMDIEPLIQPLQRALLDKRYPDNWMTGTMRRRNPVLRVERTQHLLLVIHDDAEVFQAVLDSEVENHLRVDFSRNADPHLLVASALCEGSVIVVAKNDKLSPVILTGVIERAEVEFDPAYSMTSPSWLPIVDRSPDVAETTQIERFSIEERANDGLIPRSTFHAVFDDDALALSHIRVNRRNAIDIEDAFTWVDVTGNSAGSGQVGDHRDNEQHSPPLGMHTSCEHGHEP